ncbi:MAG: glutamate 5-kinase [Rhodospirillaceae bacterium]|jgi:glutamate 5-kinase|nr:glutamate 5-kinase [Rhodospirillaceae bacterium]MBT5081078.1 glutamate 5-kinase [Rhodospirillaceae bacterium]MBT5523650.1 glutamate 5-kinase [Rhodospirillaceae bacterium]MBT5878063.1 glutamate 5-kinase [Rhodospirillaceae bacterium]MBT6589814.1 glutamate 5-kinase [Rhodospirillaceae bacterium]
MSVRLTTARRLVIKIGSSLLVDQQSGALRRDWLDALADDVAVCRGRGQDVLLVSSGAIALGRRSLGLDKKALPLEDSQAAAAAGQIRLAHAYQESLARHDVPVAQILLTSEDTEQRRRYLNARNTITALLAHGSVPVVNENDTVATAEIRFGDNDRLAARVAAMIGADCLVLLSDIDGLYSADPRRDEGAKFIAEVAEITPAIEAMAGATGSHDGSGGMVTKLQAARLASQAGCSMAIADGRTAHPIARLEDNGRATWFATAATPSSARKRWIAGSLRTKGSITIDDGAVQALTRGKSLLPTGVTGVDGHFQRGDAVIVRGPDGAALGRGLIAYSTADAERIKGHHSNEIPAILGFLGREEMIHRDDLVLG